MKTIRVTGIALSVVALLLVAMAPPASAACPTSASSGKLKGNYSFRLGPAKGFDADLANQGDPGQVITAPRQDIVRAGMFTADGAGDITAGHTLATTDTNTGDTWLINFTWQGCYTLNSDLTGTLSIGNGVCTAATTPLACCTGLGTGTCVVESSCIDTTAAVQPGTCTGYTGTTEEGSETYSISVSTTNGRVELGETDNLNGLAKIFMNGEAIKQ